MAEVREIRETRAEERYMVLDRGDTVWIRETKDVAH